MTYSYAYKTPDGERHEASLEAESREEAFSALRAQGIRPIKVVAADGSKANGEVVVKGIRKRMVALISLAVALLVTLAFLLLLHLSPSTPLPTTNNQLQTGPSGGSSLPTSLRPDERRLRASLTSKIRRQVIGDTALVEKGILDGWSDVFSEEGERFLAGFAVPGVPVSVRNTTEGEIRAALARCVGVTPEDGLEAQQIKAMVEGMKDELREFLRDGGTVIGYGNRLVQRQEDEIAHYNRAKAEIERLKSENADPALLRARWESLNDHLRALGIKLVSWPE